MTKLKIAIITNDDKLWSLYAWNNVLKTNLITEEYSCAGLWTCDQKFSNKKKLSVWSWYLNTFRLGNFIKLFFFVISFKFFAFFKSFIGKYYRSFHQLCLKNNIPHFEASTPNSPELIKWVKDNKIDILIIMVDQILKQDILNAPQIAVINKHAGLLPSNKGLFPYFWAKKLNQPQGISFHKVNLAIDEGDLVYQEKVDDPALIHSMIAFYFYVYKNYPAMLNSALKNLVQNTPVPLPENISDSYYSLPQAKDYVEFKNNGGRIITFTDLFLPAALLRN